MNRTLAAAVAIGVCALALPAEAHACAVCYGDPDSGQVIGLNRAIWVLLSIVAVVQVGFVAMFVRFVRRARNARVDAPSARDGAAE